jgi:hypothetical protein
MTTSDRTAKLAYLTQPEPGVYLLNLQFDEPGMARGKAFERVEITRDQLRNIVADGVAMVLQVGASA